MLVPSDEANEEMTLVFYYPRAFDYKDYLRPQIKLEFGRGDQQPSEKAAVISFVAEEFPKEFAKPFAEVIVLDAQRTFWEKVTLLHAENHRPDPSKLKPRMSRHWSDHCGDERLRPIRERETVPRFAANRHPLQTDLLRSELGQV
jgi:hypothetical protein